MGCIEDEVRQAMEDCSQATKKLPGPDPPRTAIIFICSADNIPARHARARAHTHTHTHTHTHHTHTHTHTHSHTHTHTHTHIVLVVVEVLLYVHINHRLIRNGGSPGGPPRLLHTAPELRKMYP